MSIDMGHHCCSKQKVKRGLWSPEEDEKLMNHINNSGHGSWSSIPKMAGLQRCGKSCRLRWINYLRPDLKRGSFSEQEEKIIIDFHRMLGNRWAQIAKQMPGRTDNEVKNFWNSCIKKKLISQGLDPNTHNLIIPHPPSSNSKTSHDSSSLHESSSITIPTYEYQKPNMVWTGHLQEQNSNASQPSMGISHVPVISSSYQSYSSELAIIIEKCKWGTRGSFEPSTSEPMATKVEEMLMEPVPQKEKACEQVEIEKRNVLKRDGNSFGSCNLLDFDFLESTLVPCEMDYHLRPMVDQLAWPTFRQQL